MSASSSKVDLEKAVSTKDAGVLVSVQPAPDDNAAPHTRGVTQRKLKSRHVQMISLAGTIGTGLFVGVGSVLYNAGPVAIWLGYTFMGAIVWSMMNGLGEMSTLFPVSGGFQHYASRFVDPALGFALGWNYWYAFGTGIATNSVAAALLVEYWPRGAELSPAIFISVFLAGIIGANALSVRIYGEAEFWLALTKLVTLTGLIILGIVITAGGGPSHEAIGFRYWREVPFKQENGIPGAWGQFLAFWTVFVQAVFSFSGVEIVALASGETQNPRRAIPKAIKGVFYRILFFYVAGTFVLGLMVSPNNDQLVNGSGVAASPWVIAIQSAGIKGLPSVINTVVILSAFSAGESDLFASSRTLYGLAVDGKAPKVFAKCNTEGVPIVATAFTFLFGGLGYMTLGTSASSAFAYLTSIASATGLLSWGSITLAYIRFYHGLRAQGISRDSLPFKAPLQPYAAYFALTMIALILLFNGYTVFLAGRWNTSTFICAYVGIPAFVGCFAFWKLFKCTRWVSLAEMDLHTGLTELDAADAEWSERELLERPSTTFGKVSRMLF